MADDRETLRRELAETLRSWAAVDTSDILGDDYDPVDKRCLCHNAEGAADALLFGPLVKRLETADAECERLAQIVDETDAENEELTAENERLRAALAIALSHLDDPRCAEVRAALDTPEGEK